MDYTFSEPWWDDFLTQTGQMSEPATFSNCFGATQTEQMRMMVMDILRDVHYKYKRKYGYRLYVDGALLSDEQAMFNRAPLPGETLEQWTARAFDGEKFGIILNRGEKFNDELSSIVATCLAPLIGKLGLPTEGLLFTVFIGNYDSTPLGIHKDLPGKSVMHFHLGPGEKTMYCWRDEDYVPRAGDKAQNNMDVQPHLAHATKHTFSAGEIYFMPENRYHLGTQKELSIGIACWWNNRSNEEWAHRIVEMTGRRLIAKSDAMLKADPRDLADAGGLDETLALFSRGESIESLSFADTLRLTLVDLRYALYSNGGLRNAPLARTEAVELDADDMLCIEHPFRLYMRAVADGEKLVLYVRGSQVEMRDVPPVRKIVDCLNLGEPVTVRHLAQLAGVDCHTCIAIVSTIIERKGVRKVAH
jgi:hypothetical protein